MHAVTAQYAEGVDPERWLDDHGDVLYRFALQRTGNPDTAEDLVQETLLAAWRGRETYRGAASERTWLVGILRHMVTDLLRRRAHNGDASAGADTVENALFTREGNWRTSPGDWGDDPLGEAEADAFLDTMSDCLQNLSPDQRTCFLLRELDDADTGEVSQVLDVSANHQYVLLHRARLAMRRCLEIRWFGGHGTP